MVLRPSLFLPAAISRRRFGIHCRYACIRHDDYGQFDLGAETKTPGGPGHPTETLHPEDFIRGSDGRARLPRPPELRPSCWGRVGIPLVRVTLSVILLVGLLRLGVQSL